MAMVASFVLADVSLGLLAFVLLMWVTVPWAFGDKVKDMVSREINRLNNDEEKDNSTELRKAKTPKEWLINAEHYFLYSGLALIAGTMSGIVTAIVGGLTILDLIFLGLGVVFLIAAMGNTYRIVEYVTTEKIVSFTLRDFMAMGTYVVMIFTLALVYFLSLVLVLPNFLSQPVASKIFALTIIPSFFAAYYLLKHRHGEANLKATLVLLLFFLPLIVLLVDTALIIIVIWIPSL